MYIIKKLKETMRSDIEILTADYKACEELLKDISKKGKKRSIFITYIKNTESDDLAIAYSYKAPISETEAYQEFLDYLRDN